MREDDRTGVSETRPDRQYRMPPCPIHSQFRVVGHDLGGRTHRTCPLSDFEPRSIWLKGATWEIPAQTYRPLVEKAMHRVIGILVILLSMSAPGAMADDDIDHCVTNEGNSIRNLCGFRLSVRYCCYGSEWYACDNTAKYNWGENPGYHEWLEPGESTGMACDPEVAGWRWAGCRAAAGSHELAPYGWDLNSTRGFRCTKDDGGQRGRAAQVVPGPSVPNEGSKAQSSPVALQWRIGGSLDQIQQIGRFAS